MTRHAPHNAIDASWLIAEAKPASAVQNGEIGKKRKISPMSRHRGIETRAKRTVLLWRGAAAQRDNQSGEHEKKKESLLLATRATESRSRCNSSQTDREELSMTGEPGAVD